MQSRLLVAAIFTVLSIAATVPAAYAAPIFDHLNITVSIDGHSATATLILVDQSGSGVIKVTLSPTTLSQIMGAFGTTTFAFPGHYTGTFHLNTSTIAVTLQSSDMYILKFVSI
jgi:hypothetical protein